MLYLLLGNLVDPVGLTSVKGVFEVSIKILNVHTILGV